MNAHLRVITPRAVNRSVPVRPANAELRSREYLTPTEVEKLIKAARAGRYGHRDATLILIAYRHGLRAVEICDLELSQVELGRSASLHVRRVKNGKPSVHPLRGDEIRALRELRRQFPTCFRVRHRARRAIHHGRRQPPHQAHRRTRGFGISSPLPHAPPCLRLCLGQRRPRHARTPRLAGPPQHPAHGQVYRAVADTVQGLLALLTGSVGQVLLTSDQGRRGRRCVCDESP